MQRQLSAIGPTWAVASPHWAATEAAERSFREDGNAVDAALAAAVTLAVVYPQACGVGGDMFALVDHPDGQTTAVNASGAAPGGFDVDGLGRAAREMPPYGPLSITVPGAVSGWDALHRLGARLPFARAFAEAIGYANDGVAVAAELAGSLSRSAERLSANPGMAGVFYAGGRALAEGDVVVQPALAGTLAAIESGGPRALYGGDVGERLVAGLQRAGSAMTIADLAAHEAELVPPLTGRYRDLDVSVVPPTSQGFVLLEILAAVERLGIDPNPLGPDAPALLGVIRVAGADRDRHNADPRRAHVHVSALLDDGHIAGLCDQVRGGYRPSVPPRGGDTVALVAADSEGWAVSLIQSLADGFGSGILEPSTGIVAHNRGSQFSLDPSSPNALEGGKRPAHTLMPVLVHRDGRLVAVSGTMGGFAQPQINAGNLIRRFDLGLSPAKAVGAPRWLVGGMDQEAEAPLFVDAEEGVPEEVTESFEAMSVRVNRLPALSGDTGHAHLLCVGADGSLEAASDPRADGSAAAG